MHSKLVPWPVESQLKGARRASGGVEPLSCHAPSFSDLGVREWPMGRIVLIHGDAQAGKTTYAVQIVADAQREGLVAAYLDADHAMQAEWARDRGADIDTLLYSRPESIEHAAELSFSLMPYCDVMVWDTLTAMPSRASLHDPPLLRPFQCPDAVHQELSAHIIRTLHQRAFASRTICVIVCQERTVPTDRLVQYQMRIAAPRVLSGLASLRIEVSNEEGGVIRAKLKSTKMQARPGGSYYVSAPFNSLT